MEHVGKRFVVCASASAEGQIGAPGDAAFRRWGDWAFSLSQGFRQSSTPKGFMIVQTNFLIGVFVRS
jgi:hypothetical protein